MIQTNYNIIPLPFPLGRLANADPSRVTTVKRDRGEYLSSVRHVCWMVRKGVKYQIIRFLSTFRCKCQPCMESVQDVGQGGKQSNIPIFFPRHPELVEGRGKCLPADWLVSRVKHVRWMLRKGVLNHN